MLGFRTVGGTACKLSCFCKRSLLLKSNRIRCMPSKDNGILALHFAARRSYPEDRYMACVGRHAWAPPQGGGGVSPSIFLFFKITPMDAGRAQHRAGSILNMKGFILGLMTHSRPEPGIGLTEKAHRMPKMSERAHSYLND